MHVTAVTERFHLRSMSCKEGERERERQRERETEREREREREGEREREPLKHQNPIPMTQLLPQGNAF